MEWPHQDLGQLSSLPQTCNCRTPCAGKPVNRNPQELSFPAVLTRGWAVGGGGRGGEMQILPYGHLRICLPHQVCVFTVFFGNLCCREHWCYGLGM